MHVSGGEKVQLIIFGALDDLAARVLELEGADACEHRCGEARALQRLLIQLGLAPAGSCSRTASTVPFSHVLIAPRESKNS